MTTYTVHTLDNEKMMAQNKKTKHTATRHELDDDASNDDCDDDARSSAHVREHKTNGNVKEIIRLMRTRLRLRWLHPLGPQNESERE